jgi:hypothetical protein
MMTPNSFQQVVAADDVAARKALSELGSAPLPPVAEFEAAEIYLKKLRYSLVSRMTSRSWTQLDKAIAAIRSACATERRATGGNDKLTDAP